VVLQLRKELAGEGEPLPPERLQHLAEQRVRRGASRSAGSRGSLLAAPPARARMVREGVERQDERRLRYHLVTRRLRGASLANTTPIGFTTTTIVLPTSTLTIPTTTTARTLTTTTVVLPTTTLTLPLPTTSATLPATTLTLPVTTTSATLPATTLTLPVTTTS